MEVTTPTGVSIQSGESVINLSGKADLSDGKTTELGQFCGNVLLYDRNPTPLRIARFEWDEPLATDTLDGSLTILFCSYGISAVQLFTPASISPNPNPGELKIETQLNSPGRIQITISDLLGQKRLLIEDNAQKGKYQKTIDIGSLPAGVYCITFSDTDKRWSKHFIKE